MERITRNVAEIEAHDRQVLEHIFGQQLRDNQQVVIQIVNIEVSQGTSNGRPAVGTLPDWCNVYEGLTDDQIADLERVVLTRAELSRTTN